MRTDGWTDVTKLIVTFCNFANANAPNSRVGSVGVSDQDVSELPSRQSQHFYVYKAPRSTLGPSLPTIHRVRGFFPRGKAART